MEQDFPSGLVLPVFLLAVWLAVSALARLRDADPRLDAREAAPPPGAPPTTDPLAHLRRRAAARDVRDGMRRASDRRVRQPPDARDAGGTSDAVLRYFKERERARAPASPSPKRSGVNQPTPTGSWRDEDFDFGRLNGVSPLSVHGYRTGRSSKLLPRERRRCLLRATEGYVPNIYQAAGCDIWGAPGTLRRKRRIASFLPWLIRRDEANHRLEQSVKDRRADLDWYLSHFELS